MIDKVAQDGQTIGLGGCFAKIGVLGVVVDKVNFRVVLLLVECVLRAHVESILSHAAPVKVESEEFIFTIFPRNIIKSESKLWSLNVS